MVKLIFATANPSKLKESRRILRWICGDQITILSGVEAGVDQPAEVDEISPTFAGNAYLKAQAYLTPSSYPVLAEDTGLCINCLGGKPGVKSNRWFAGTAHDRNQEVLRLMIETSDRSAYFTSVFCLLYPDRPQSPIYFTAYTYGSISDTKHGVGDQGFGYDPIFMPKGSDRTYAQMTGPEKDQYSHRAKALRQLVDYLNLKAILKN